MTKTRSRKGKWEAARDNSVSFRASDIVAPRNRPNGKTSLIIVVWCGRLPPLLTQNSFRKFPDSDGAVCITDDEIIVRLLEHAHNPVLREARIDQPADPNAWLGSKPLRIELP